MKLYLLLLFLSSLAIADTIAQSNQVALQLSLKQVELVYHRSTKEKSFWGEVYSGTGKYDLSPGFNDFYCGLRAGISILKFKRSGLSAAACTGIYIPRNDYYKAATMVYGLNLGYERYFGKSGMHSLLLDCGYRFGRKEYIQTYENSIMKVNTSGIFRIPPFYFSAGYGFNF